MSRTPELCRIDGKKIQVTLKDEPEYSADVPEHTVEAGPNIGDSIKPKLIVYDMDGVVSDVKGQGDDSLSPEAFQALMEDLFTSRRPVPVFAPRWQFNSMVCLSFKPKRRGSGLAFSSKWREFRTVNARSVVVKVVLGEKSKQGRIQPEEIPPQADRGLLEDIVNGPAVRDATQKDLQTFGPLAATPASIPSAAPAPTLSSPFAGRSTPGSAHGVQ